jgi:hypothetical protein
MTAAGKPTRHSSTGRSYGVWWSLAGYVVVTMTTGLLLGSLYLEYFAKAFLLPQLDLMRFSEDDKGQLGGLTYYHRVCFAHDMTTTDPTDFTVTQNTSTDEAVQLMLQHGTTLLPGLLRPETAEPLRNFILHENQINQELFYVIENKNRWSFPIRVDQDPAVTAALEELLTNAHLVTLLEALMGPDPAVIEFTAITAAEGATEQFWHQDGNVAIAPFLCFCCCLFSHTTNNRHHHHPGPVVPTGSATKYARHFIPSYSLFIPLQNTTGEMGATGICPGTHVCSKATFCEETGFQVSGEKHTRKARIEWSLS